MSKTYESLVAELDAKLPREAVMERDAGQGRRLSYVSGAYVIDRLNKTIGQGNWGYKTDELRKVHEGEVNGKFVVSYISTVTLTATLVDRTVSIQDVGFGDGMDARNPGKSHELAVKEAVTDAIKRCAKSLGMSLGLALYSKDQENVDEGEPEVKPTSPAKLNAVKLVEPEAAPTNAESTRQKLIKRIGLTGRILMDKKVISLDELKSKLKLYGVSAKEDLLLNQAEMLDKDLTALLGA
jgi:recombination DNA repair RAD52 pathway protein